MKKFLPILLAVFFANLVSSQNVHVNSGNYYYTPSSLSINVGDTVKWINDGDSIM